MLFTIALVLLALTMGGLLFTLGIIQSILAKVESLFKSAGSVITGAAITGIGVNTLIGEQYLSILLTGEAFKAQFAKVGLAPKPFTRHGGCRYGRQSSCALECLWYFYHKCPRYFHTGLPTIHLLLFTWSDSNDLVWLEWQNINEALTIAKGS